MQSMLRQIEAQQKRRGRCVVARRALRRNLLYCSLSGFGQTGPLGSMLAYAHAVWQYRPPCIVDDEQSAQEMNYAITR